LTGSVNALKPSLSSLLYKSEPFFVNSVRLVSAIFRSCLACVIIGAEVSTQVLADVIATAWPLALSNWGCGQGISFLSILG